ncbi:MAG: DUF1285 domain-containing protein [Pseudomonadales bacterium]
MAERLNPLFDELIQLQQEKRLPPVDAWQPPRTASIDIRIDADGTWYHEGEPIRRKPLVKLFATILRRDADGFCLVTPAEKLLIEVVDAPFLAVDMEVRGAGADQEILLVTNVDDAVMLDDGHPLRVAGLPDAPRPYVRVRGGLDALIARSVYYRLVDLCEGPDAGGAFTLRSCGAQFRLG